MAVKRASPTRLSPLPVPFAHCILENHHSGSADGVHVTITSLKPPTDGRAVGALVAARQEDAPVPNHGLVHSDPRLRALASERIGTGTATTATREAIVLRHKCN